MSSETIKEITLREFAGANLVSSSQAQGRKGGFALSVKCGDVEKVLASARGEIRLFPNLTNLAAFLRKLGIQRFEVNTAEYEPGRVRSPRPDRAEALRRTRTTLKQSSLFGEG